MSSRFRHRYKSFRTSVVHSANNWINAYLEGDQRFKQFDTVRLFLLFIALKAHSSLSMTSSAFISFFRPFLLFSFKLRTLIKSFQVTQQLLLEKLEFNDEFQLLAACYNEVTASNSNVLMDFDGKFETDLDQRPEDKSKETGLTVLISGHNLIGALWKLEGSSAFDNYLRDKIKPWLLMDLDAHKKSSEISSISHECDATLSDDLSRFKLILTARDVIRWKMAWRALCALREHEEKDSKKIAEKKDSEENSENKSDEEIFDEAISKKKSDRGGFLGDYNRVGRYDRFLLRRCNDWPETYELFEPQIAFGFGMGTLIYGGLHALAWSANFHSPVERILWRVSTCVVMGGVPVLFVLSLVMRRLIPVYAVSSIHWRYSFFKTMLDTIFPHIPELVALLIFAAYVLARAYLVVECFINLFHLPAAVYDVPTWSVYFPHIS